MEIQNTEFLTISVWLAQFITLIHILLKKSSEPTSAVLWIFVIFSLDAFGIIIYILFGINRLQTTGLKVELSNKLINSEKATPASKGMKNYLKNQIDFAVTDYNNDPKHYHSALDRIFLDKPLLSGNRVTLLEDGDTVYPEMLKCIKSAKSSIHLQSYIIMNDKLGRKLLNALELKAKEGVDVKVLYDSFGSYKAVWSSFFSKYKNINLPHQTRAFIKSTLFSPWRIQLRNHRKLLVVDGKKAFIGGMNITEENKKKVVKKSKYVHDIHCTIEGPSVAELQFSFLRDWYYTTTSDPAVLFTNKNFPVLSKCGESSIRVIDSGPGQCFEASFKNLTAAISTARKFVWIMTPYFIPDKAFVEILKLAVARDIEIRLLIPSTIDHWYVRAASKSYYRDLLESGIKIFEKRGDFMHSKAVLIDEEIVSMGSSNCDNRSFRLNYELDFVVSGDGFPNTLYKYFLTEFNNSDEVTLAMEANKNIFSTLKENMCSLLSSVL